MTEALNLENALVALSGVTLVIQLLAWRWVRRLRDQLDGDGRELVSIISFLLGWTVVLRLISYVGLLYFAHSGTTDQVVVITVFTQVAFLFIVWVVWRRLNRFTSSP